MVHHIDKCLQFAYSQGQEIKGAFLVPISNPAHGHSPGELCVALGRERSGVYQGLLNFFGGKVEHGLDPLTTLLKEVEEEMCVRLSLEDLSKCVVGAWLVGKTMLVFAHVTELNDTAWSQVMLERRQRNAPFSRLEMSQFLHVPLTQLSSRWDVSEFVKQNIEHVVKHSKRITNDNAVVAHGKWYS